MSAGGLDAAPLQETPRLFEPSHRVTESPELTDPSLSNCTDNMLICRWTKQAGWEEPEIRPYGPLSVMPTASVFHYATECFESIKAYRGHDGKLRVFRLELNCQRLLKSSTQTGLPAFDPVALEKLIRHFAAHESQTWLPSNETGQTLYFRPAHIGTTPRLGLQVPRHSTLFVVATRTSGFQTDGAMTVVTSPANMVRAWPGGFGNAKLGANYGPPLVAHADAVSQGFNQVLWLFGQEGYATEAGASNFFVAWRTREGKVQLVTPGLDNQTILDGVTRKSVLELVQSNSAALGSWEVDGKALEVPDVVERDFSIGEIRESLAEGRLIEAFASGTAYFIAPICLIRHQDLDLDIPCGTGKDGTGLYAALIKGWLEDIVFGRRDLQGWTSVVDETVTA